MRKLILFTFFVLLNLLVYCQCDTTIIGKWKVVSIKANGLYVNLKTDSSFIELDLFGATMTKEMIIEMIREVWGSSQFEFTKDNSYHFKIMADITENGSYCFNSSKKILTQTFKNDLGETYSEQNKAYIKDGYLYLYMAKVEDKEINDTEMIFELERVNNQEAGNFGTASWFRLQRLSSYPLQKSTSSRVSPPSISAPVHWQVPFLLPVLLWRLMQW
jgi:hypothetical protein